MQQLILVLNCGSSSVKFTLFDIGLENEVADGSASILFPQAHNRLHAQKAILAHLLGGVPLE